MSEATEHAPVEIGYAQIGDLRMYYETYGAGDGTPLLVLLGGLFDIQQQFGALLPGLSADRRVIAADFQAHGRTNDIDRPLGIPELAKDVVALLEHLGLTRVDVFGFSVGGAVTLELALHHPDLARRIVVSSTSISPDGDRGGNTEAVMETTVDMIAGTPMEQAYYAKSPHPDPERRLRRCAGVSARRLPWHDALQRPRAYRPRPRYRPPFSERTGMSLCP